MAELTKHQVSFEELEEIIMVIKNLSDFDFKGYTRSSLKRRIQRVMGINNMDFVDLKNAMVNIAGFQNYLIREITVNVTEMFRDPEFYNQLVKTVIPYLRTYPQIKIWSAGCSSGEEVYSLAIMLREHQLWERIFIYGTDVNPCILDTARKGIYPLNKIKIYTENFNKFVSTESLSKYYTADDDVATISHELKKRILFSTHNLAADSVFNEFQLILCRNVMIYFDLELQEHVFQLLYDSLVPFGFLCLGTHESLMNHNIKSRFKTISKEYNIYQKIQ